MCGIERLQLGYTSGTWQGDKLNVFDDVSKFWLPWNKLSSELKHDQRLVISMLQDEPYTYKISRVKNTAPKGMISFTVEQDRFDKNKDFVDWDTGEMYADYYSSAITPEDVEVEEVNTDVLSIEAKNYNVRIGGNKTIYFKVLDKDSNDVTNNYYDENILPKWEFEFNDIELDTELTDELIDQLIIQNDNNSEDNWYKCDFDFKYDKDMFKDNGLKRTDFLNRKITVRLTVGNLSASADLNIIS